MDYRWDGQHDLYVHPETGVTILGEHMPDELMPHPRISYAPHDLVAQLAERQARRYREFLDRLG